MNPTLHFIITLWTYLYSIDAWKHRSGWEPIPAIDERLEW